MNSHELNWRKSSYSGGEGGECLEIATDHAAIHIRDSKTPTAPHLTLSPTTWLAFLPHLSPTNSPATPQETAE
ncbi:DUF397 domain-containing protein [Streptomyces sp. NPDC001843]|uniref:DUF397 domain-containing protein n=1 Tax=Streptomyces sp. NPDC001843 TaxID=3364617 RepID=UPI0036CF0C28